jgi:hypothetical protein
LINLSCQSYNCLRPTACLVFSTYPASFAQEYAFPCPSYCIALRHQSRTLAPTESHSHTSITLHCANKSTLTHDHHIVLYCAIRAILLRQQNSTHPRASHCIAPTEVNDAITKIPESGLPEVPAIFMHDDPASSSFDDSGELFFFLASHLFSLERNSSTGLGVNHLGSRASV